MSNGFDYFGNALPPTGAQATAGTSPYASVHSFAPPPSAPQYGYTPTPYAPSSSAPPTSSRSRRPLIVVAVVVIAAAAVAGVAITQRAHPIAMPSTLAGLPKANLQAVGADIKATKKKLSQSGIHNVSVALYGDTGGNGSQALAVVAGHPAAGVANFGQLVSAMTTSTQIAGVTITPSAVTLGSATFQCQTIAVASSSVGLCEWQTPSTILFGVGQGLTTGDTAAALADVIGADQLH